MVFSLAHTSSLVGQDPLVSSSSAKPSYQLQSSPPTTCGGVTVAYVNGFNEKDTLYYDDIEEREDAGTPPIVQKIRAALAFWIKEFMGYGLISSLDTKQLQLAIERLLPTPNIHVLGNTGVRRHSILSFLVFSRPATSFFNNMTRESPGGGGKSLLWRDTRSNADMPLHGRFVAKLLNDLFGIRARCGCACSGPCGHRLLNIDKILSLALRSAIQRGYGGVKPGWTGVSFPFYMSTEEVEFIAAAIEFLDSYGHCFLPLYRFNWRSGEWSFRKSMHPVVSILLSLKEHSNLSAAISQLTVHPARDRSDASVNENKLPNSNGRAYNTRLSNKHALYLETARNIVDALPDFPLARKVPKDIDLSIALFRVQMYECQHHILKTPTAPKIYSDIKLLKPLYAISLTKGTQNPSLWSHLIKAYLSQGCPKEALLVYTQARPVGIIPCAVLPVELKACATLSHFLHGRSLHADSIKAGAVLHLMIGTSLVSMYWKCGDLGDARKVFEEMPERNVVTLNAMIAGYSMNGDMDSASLLFERIPDRTPVTWAEMISGFARTGDTVAARRLFDRTPPEMRNVVTWTVMVEGYASIGEMEAARQVFGEMPERNFFSWSSMIAGYCKQGSEEGCAQNGRCEEALEAFQKMQMEGFEPDEGPVWPRISELNGFFTVGPNRPEVTVANALSACAQLGSLDFGTEIHELINRKRIKLNQFVLWADQSECKMWRRQNCKKDLQGDENKE
ncbi:hypothetical protein ACLOJK_012029 [Asimina triloba]